MPTVYRVLRITAGVAIALFVLNLGLKTFLPSVRSYFGLAG